MKVAFFADDASAHDAALLTAYAGDLGKDAPNEPWSIQRESLSEPVFPAGEDIPTRIMALPLSRLADPGIRRHIDLAVVTHGSTHGAAAGARRAIAAMGAHDGASPAWLLPCCRLADTTGLRTLPLGMPGLRRYEAAGLLNGQASPTVARLAVALTASLLIAAADPFAAILDRPRVLAALADDASGLDLALRDRLLDLADTIDDAEWDEAGTRARTEAPGWPAPVRRSHRDARRHGRRTIEAQPAQHRRTLACSRATHA